MTLTTLAPLCGGLSVAVLAMLAGVVARDPVRGLAQLTHRPAQLPLVLADRYVAFAGLALAALVWGDLRMLLALFLAFAFMGFADGRIYARAGHPHIKHTASGVASLVGAAVVGAALISGGTQ